MRHPTSRLLQCQDAAVSCLRPSKQPPPTTFRPLTPCSHPPKTDPYPNPDWRPLQHQRWNLPLSLPPENLSSHPFLLHLPVSLSTPIHVHSPHPAGPPTKDPVANPKWRLLQNRTALGPSCMTRYIFQPLSTHSPLTSYHCPPMKVPCANPKWRPLQHPRWSCPLCERPGCTGSVTEGERHHCVHTKSVDKGGAQLELSSIETAAKG